MLPGAARPGYNYVLVARPAVLTCPFDRLLSDLATAFARVTVGAARRRPHPRQPAGTGRWPVSVADLAPCLPIRLYRYAVSPWIGPRCRYLPTCSEYALEALARHGPLRRQLVDALRRIARCHPWGGFGYDPVPAPAEPALKPCGARIDRARAGPRAASRGLEETGTVMPEQRNLILAIVLSVTIILAFQYFYELPRIKEAQRQEATPTEQAVDRGGASDAWRRCGRAQRRPARRARAGRPGQRPQRDLAGAERVDLDNGRIHGSLALTGGRIDNVILSDYRVTTAPGSPDVALLSPPGAPDPYFVEFGWVAADQAVRGARPRHGLAAPTAPSCAPASRSR